MPVTVGYDDKGKYYQWGNQSKYHVSKYGEDGARKKAYAQQSAIERSGYEKGTVKKMVHHVIVGYDQRGQYYRWGEFGTRYYVHEHGDMRARKLAYMEGQSERLRGGYDRDRINY